VKGTWLLAAAAWVGTCALVDLALPVVPRAYLHLPADSDVVGLGPNAELALVRRDVWLTPKKDDDGRMALELFDVVAGKSVTTLLDPCGQIWLSGQSSDGQTWLLQRHGDLPRLFRFDLPNRSLHPLSAPLDYPDIACEAMSKDGRLCVLSDKSKGSLILWDTTDDRRHAELPGLGPPIAVSADGRSLVAASSGSGEKRILVVDLATLATRFAANFKPDQLTTHCTADISSDGLYASLTENTYGLNFQAHCWNVVANKKCFGRGTPRHGEIGRLVGRNSLIVESANDEPEKTLQWVNLDTGQMKKAVPIDRWAPWGVSPTSETVVLWVKAEQASAVKRMVERVGIRWPFSTNERIGPTFFDAHSGNYLGSIPPQWQAAYVPDHFKWWSPPMRWSPDGQFMAIGDHRDPTNPEGGREWQLWDVPPRKSLIWFALAAAILALPIAWLARRRVRRLRKEPA
jgi:hypothetical protein